jgi:hypothetical protein
MLVQHGALRALTRRCNWCRLPMWSTSVPAPSTAVRPAAERSFAPGPRSAWRDAPGARVMFRSTVTAPLAVLRPSLLYGAQDQRLWAQPLSPVGRKRRPLHCLARVGTPRPCSYDVAGGCACRRRSRGTEHRPGQVLRFVTSHKTWSGCGERSTCTARASGPMPHNVPFDPLPPSRHLQFQLHAAGKGLRWPSPVPVPGG